jgi:hypothetical protein
MNQIRIGGKDRPIVFGMSTLAAYCHAKKVPLARMEKAFTDMTLQDTIDLIYYALVSGCRRHKLEPDFDRDDIDIWVDENPNGFAEAMLIFTESQNAQLSDNTDKKKLKKAN